MSNARFAYRGDQGDQQSQDGKPFSGCAFLRNARSVSSGVSALPLFMVCMARKRPVSPSHKAKAASGALEVRIALGRGPQQDLFDTLLEKYRDRVELSLRPWCG
jgi:hypothetical protein